MPRPAEADELRSAVLSLYAVLATVVSPEVCAQLHDASSEMAAEIDPTTIGASAEAATRVRLGGVRLLNSFCGACRACPRGRGGYMPPPLTVRPPSEAA